MLQNQTTVMTTKTDMVQFHALALMKTIKQNDKLAISKVRCALWALYDSWLVSLLKRECGYSVCEMLSPLTLLSVYVASDSLCRS